MLLLFRKKLHVLFIVCLVCCGFLIYSVIEKVENRTLPETKRTEEEGGSQFMSPANTLFKLYDKVEVFVMFIGYPRSSHSLMGALLDAHPEIIIPHEYHLMTMWQRYKAPDVIKHNMQKYLLFHDLFKLSKTQALFGIRAKNYVLNRLHFYSYHVPNSWQGGYKGKIKVIGDKKGGSTSVKLRDPNNMAILEEIEQVVQVPIRFIHVTRNPFDNISTMLLQLVNVREAVRDDEGMKVNNPKALNATIEEYFALVEANERVIQRYGDAVINVPGHELVLRPRETLQRLCEHLTVTCSEEYFEQCRNVTYGSPSVTRNNVIWTAEQKDRVTEMMEKYSFLKGYSFDEYPI